MKLNFKEQKATDKSVVATAENVRIIWLSLATPNTKFANESKPGYYTLTMIIPKDEEKFISRLEKSIRQVVSTSPVFNDIKIGGVNKDLKQKTLKIALDHGEEEAVLKDGDDQTDKDGRSYEFLENTWIMRAKTNAVDKDGVLMPQFPLHLRDSRNKKLAGPQVVEEFYPGCYANVQISLTPYVVGKNMGVTVYLQAVQKVKDGERLGGDGTYFDAIEVDDEDLDDIDDIFGEDEEEEEEEEQPPQRRPAARQSTPPTRRQPKASKKTREKPTKTGRR